VNEPTLQDSGPPGSDGLAGLPTADSAPPESRQSVPPLSPASELLPRPLGNYQLLRRLGSGGMGVVYEALDREWQRHVAVKVLPRMEPTALQRFKFEFRCAADLSHPNLVALYSLGHEGEDWFLAMELVRGKGLLDYLSDSSRPGPDAPTEVDYWGRLRAIFAQLARGVHALHRAHVLHLDLKPGNILVETGGRVVVLDFGLARPAARARRPWVVGRDALVGTVAYMAPEQGRGSVADEAADWYALGVTLFEALTGELPFEAPNPVALLLRKGSEPAPRPSTLRPGVPPDLDQLCADLMERQPQDRPLGADILRRLEPALAPGTTPSPSSRQDSPAPAAEFFGRSTELARLEAAYAEALSGVSTWALVAGPSGIGKSALLRAFLDARPRADRTLVLQGRCYEREVLPFKAVDGVIDALTEDLRLWPEAALQAVLPRDLSAPATIFPVLRRLLPEGEGIEPPAQATVSPLELRRRAFRALRALLQKVAERRPLILFIDDLQWGDEDSARLLRELSSPPLPAPLLLLGSYRSEEAAVSPLLRELLHGAEGSVVDSRFHLTLGDLEAGEARRLVTALLPPEFSDRQVDRLLREGRGNPFLLEQLALHNAARPSPPPDSRVEAPFSGAGLLAEVLRGQLDELDPPLRRLFQLVAVAGRPLRQGVAVQAARVGLDASKAFGALRTARLVRTRGGRNEDLVECYHDRLRTAALESMEPAALAQAHLSLARTLVALRIDEPDTLALHWHGAGDLARAADAAEKAARRAAETLAFDLAALRYQQALEWGSWPPSLAQALRRCRAEALVHGGRGSAAAQQYLEASREAGPAEHAELLRLASEQLLLSGHVNEGVALLEDTLPAMGLRYPRTSRVATSGAVVRALRLALRGIAFRHQQEREIPATTLARVDLERSLCKGLFAVDSMRGIYFGLDALLTALKVGEAHRVAWGLAMMGGVVLSAVGGRIGRWGQGLQRAAEALARTTRDPYLEGLTSVSAGQYAILAGNWTAALELSDVGVRTLQARCTGVAWEGNFGRMNALRALEELGMAQHYTERATLMLREAEAAGDRYGQVTALLYLGAAQLMMGDPAAARRNAAEALTRWSHDGYTMQHFYAMRLDAWADLYEGRPHGAWRRLQADWGQVRRSGMMSVPLTRADAVLLQAQIALAAVHRPEGGAAARRTCRRGATALRRMARPDLVAQADLVDAALACLDGDRDRAMVLLRSSIDGFERREMAGMAAAALARWGELAGGDEGQSAVGEALGALRRAGIRQPQAWVGLRAPGFEKSQPLLAAPASPGARP